MRKAPSPRSPRTQTRRRTKLATFHSLFVRRRSSSSSASASASSFPHPKRIQTRASTRAAIWSGRHPHSVAPCRSAAATTLKPSTPRSLGRPPARSASDSQRVWPRFLVLLLPPPSSSSSSTSSSSSSLLLLLLWCEVATRRYSLRPERLTPSPSRSADHIQSVALGAQRVSRLTNPARGCASFTKGQRRAKSHRVKTSPAQRTSESCQPSVESKLGAGSGSAVRLAASLALSADARARVLGGSSKVLEARTLIEEARPQTRTHVTVALRLLRKPTTTAVTLERPRQHEGATRLSSLVTGLAAMSPPIRSCLLLLVGALVAHAAHMEPHPELRKILEDIAKDVDLKSVNISTQPPFNGVIRSIKACQNREEVKLTNATLRVYVHILESILHNATLLKAVPDRARREQLRRNVDHLTNKMRRLSADLAHRRCPDTSDVLRQLAQLKVDDMTFQKRALSQFLEVYNMATVIGSRALAPPTEASP